MIISMSPNPEVSPLRAERKDIQLLYPREVGSSYRLSPGPRFGMTGEP
jgi:hypothetical protein